MKREWELETALREIDATFRNPKMHYEQYITPPEIAAQCLWVAKGDGNIIGKTVLDLGCGTGTLTVGAALLGAAHVIGVDADSECLATALDNSDELSNVSLVQFEVTPTSSFKSLIRGHVDTVITNPPFGTKTQAHADTMFVTAALEVANIVYSMHLSTNRDFLVKWATTRLEGVKCTPVAQLKYNMDKCYNKHKKSSKDINVDFMRWERM